MSTNSNPINKELLTLRNGIFALFSDNVICITTWSAYLFDSKFDDEPELRYKIGVIWLASLLDSLEGELRTLDKYKKEANSMNQPNLIALCNNASDFFSTVREVLSLYNREEQLYILDSRDQFVHSWLSKRHNEKFKVKYVSQGMIITEEVTRVKYYEDLEPFFLDTRGATYALSSFVERFKKPLRYWSALNSIHGQMDKLHDAIFGDIEYDII